MRTTTLSSVAGLAMLGLMIGLTAPATASTGAHHVSGSGAFDTQGVCPADPPPGFESYIDIPPIVLIGSLDGCLYIDIEWQEDLGAPSGVYREGGSEVFVGSLDGGPEGQFETDYRFTSKWDPDAGSGAQVNGRCQHPLVAGSGVGGFEGATGRLDFKDDVVAGTIDYRGHIRIG